MGDIAVRVMFLGAIKSAAKRKDMAVTLAEGSTAESLLRHLAERLGPDVAGYLFRKDGALLPHVRVSVNGEEIKEMETKLTGGEVDILIVPTYGGG